MQPFKEEGQSYLATCHSAWKLKKHTTFPLWILLHQSIYQGCSLAPYLYMCMIDALGYLLEFACIAGQVRGI
jgi:hypothetical protein